MGLQTNNCRIILSYCIKKVSGGQDCRIIFALEIFVIYKRLHFPFEGFFRLFFFWFFGLMTSFFGDFGFLRTIIWSVSFSNVSSIPTFV